MTELRLGDLVKNDVQSAVVRWLGKIAGRSIVGLESITADLPGYTDGTCSLDNQRHFHCSNGRGYYILRSAFANFYRIAPRNNGESEENYHSAEASPDSSPKTRPAPPIPVISVDKSPSRGILSRVMSDSERQKSSNASQPNRSSKMYRPEHYRSATFESTTASSDTNRQLSRSKETSPSDDRLSFGHEYYLDNWTFTQIKSLLENEIPPKGQLSLLIGVDEGDVQTLVDEQMNNSASFYWTTAPKEIRLEVTRIFTTVKSIFPSRTIRLRDNDYLLLVIFCSRNECAYVRTRAGWTLVHDDVGQNHVIPEISDMIDGFSTVSRCQSEVCWHVLKNASFLYYKLVE